MSFTIPVIRATMGSRVYYIGKMTAKQLSGQIGIASELEDWQTQTLEEVYQRKLSEKRVLQTIAPYLAKNDDRFFGSIIVWARDSSVLEFEPLSYLIEQVNLGAAYREALDALGTITFGDDEPAAKAGLVALDGQHRLAALRANVQGKVQGPYVGAVASDEVTVIFISDEDRVLSRSLFTILNRTARRVTKNDVLIMSETDGAAVAARRVVAEPLLAPRGLDDQPLIKWESNTIAKKDTQLTTLNAIVDVAATIGALHEMTLSDDDDAQVTPADADVDKVTSLLRSWLDLFFGTVTELEEMRHDANLVVEGRKPDAPYSMLLRPIGFITFFRAVAGALRLDHGQVRDVRTAIERLASLNWSLDSSLWKLVLVDSQGHMSRRDADINLAADLAVWMIAGSTVGEQFQAHLLERYRRQLGRADATLPTPLS